MPMLEQTMALVLSLPREAGTPAGARAREAVTAYLMGLGYQVSIQRFSFAPASLNAFPVFGAGLGGLALLLMPLLSAADAPVWGALLLWITGLASLALLAFGIGAGWITLGAVLREDANLIATRSEAPVRRWIVAHLDTKAQGHSMAGRLVAVWVIGAAVVGLGALAALRLRGALSLPLVAAGAALALLAGALAGGGRLRGTSQGARDNGSGVFAALAAAGASLDPKTGVLITGAEEFGLVGARVFARLSPERLRGSVVINLDTIDQEGELYLVTHDRRGDALAPVEAARLEAAGLAPRRRRLPLGILVDSVPLARAGVPALTVGRLTWRTLRRIHTPRDTADDFSLATAERIGRALGAN
ncbi:MAG: M28 family peptidase [Gemmatimonadales bacterium]